MASTLTRRVLGTSISLILAILLLPGLAGTAHAADGYRYWNYFHLDNGSWSFSDVGAADYEPEDGDVEGYRFGTSTPAENLPPRADLDEVNFDTVCGEEQATGDDKRIAVVIDYGTAADAGGETPPDPRAACAVVGAQANGQEVLAAVADLRIEDGLTCAFDGYPAQGCGEPVPDASVATQEQPVAFELPGNAAAEDADAASSDTADDSGLLWPLVGVILVVILIAGAAVLLNRRKKTAA